MELSQTKKLGIQYYLIILLLLVGSVSALAVNNNTNIVCSSQPIQVKSEKKIQCKQENIVDNSKCEQAQRRNLENHYLDLCLIKDRQSYLLNLEVKAKNQLEEYYLTVDQNHLQSNNLLSLLFDNSIKSLFDQMKVSNHISIKENGFIGLSVKVRQSLKPVVFVTKKRDLNIWKILINKTLKLQKQDEVFEAKFKELQIEKLKQIVKKLDKQLQQLKTQQLISSQKNAVLAQKLFQIEKKNNLPEQKYLTRQQILQSVWAFYNDNSYCGQMTFQENGQISTYNNNNQRFWSLQDKGILSMYKGDRSLGAKFIASFKDYNNRWNLHGRFSGQIWRHYLVQLRRR